CRIMMTIFDLPPERLAKDRERFESILERNTLFGTGAGFKKKSDHAVLEEDWKATPLLASLKDKTWNQLGSSGSGNHFVEFGELEVFSTPGMSGANPADPASNNQQAPLGLRPGRYLALLSHSGSRGPGAQVAAHYSALARKLHPDLPKDLSF